MSDHVHIVHAPSSPFMNHLYDMPSSIIYTDEHAPGPCSVDITGLFSEYTATSVVEATPDFLEVPHDHEEDALEGREGGKVLEGTKARQFLIELYPLQLKSLIITLQ